MSGEQAGLRPRASLQTARHPPETQQGTRLNTMHTICIHYRASARKMALCVALALSVAGCSIMHPPVLYQPVEVQTTPGQVMLTCPQGGSLEVHQKPQNTKSEEEPEPEYVCSKKGYGALEVILPILAVLIGLSIGGEEE